MWVNVLLSCSPGTSTVFKNMRLDNSTWLSLLPTGNNMSAWHQNSASGLLQDLRASYGMSPPPFQITPGKESTSPFWVLLLLWLFNFLMKAKRLHQISKNHSEDDNVIITTVYHVPGIVIIHLHALFHVIIPTSLGTQDYCPHFTYKETEAWQD